MSEKFNAEEAITTMKRFITGQMLKSGLSGFVVGLSGGIDSALSATLAVEAIGKEKVYGVLMPYKTSSESSVVDAMELVNKLGIGFEKVDISPMIDVYFPNIDEEVKLRAGNKMARERMSILFDIAFKMQRLVLGTGNRTEISLGYTTLFGDAACSINPIGELYKTEVRQISKILGVPESIINKPPSADLWAGQTDEAEIGVSYTQIDSLLKAIVDEQVVSMSALEEAGFNSPDISRIVSLLNRNAFKRNLPPVTPLGRCAVPDAVQLQD